jgi:hypothetical protein
VASPGFGDESTESVELLAAYLYDSIMLYARTAGHVLRAKGSLSNGLAVVEAMKNISFHGATGFVRLDANGDRMDSIQIVNVNVTTAGGVATLERVPVGVFYAALKQYTPEAGRTVVWPGGTTTKPVDSLQLCDAGKYMLDGGVRCDLCPAGTFSAGDTSTCTPCAPGAAMCLENATVVACRAAVVLRAQLRLVEGLVGGCH